VNTFKRHVWLAIVLASATVWPLLLGAQSETAGVAQYFNNCASCHESTDITHQAPRTSVLKQMTPEHVFEVLTTGSMRSNAAANPEMCCSHLRRLYGWRSTRTK
jgi:cytochrome c553